jgi:hypothetical protein
MFISLRAQYEMKMLNNDGLLSFPRRRESRKWHAGNWIPAPCLRRDRPRRNDRYGAFSFPYSLSSLMMSGFSLLIEISVYIDSLASLRSVFALFWEGEAPAFVLWLSLRTVEPLRRNGSPGGSPSRLLAKSSNSFANLL